jgi:hypothetical protein
MFAAQRAHLVEHVTDRSSERQRFRCRLHAVRYPHKQRIVEIAA